MGDPSDPLSLNRYVYCNMDPVNYVDPTGFAGVIVSASEETDAGLLTDPSAGQSGSVGAGVFINGFDLKSLSFGAFTSFGAFWKGISGNGGSSTGEDVSNSKMTGLYAGAGLNFALTNANSVQDLKGLSNQVSINVAWFLKTFSLQISTSDSGIWVVSYGGAPVPGGGFGASWGGYQTYTTPRYDTRKK